MLDFIDWLDRKSEITAETVSNLRCRDYLEKLRWADGLICPKCGVIFTAYRGSCWCVHFVILPLVELKGYQVYINSKIKYPSKYFLGHWYLRAAVGATCNGFDDGLMVDAVEDTDRESTQSRREVAPFFLCAGDHDRRQDAESDQF